MFDFDSLLRSLKDLLEMVQRYPEALKTLHMYLHTFHLILAAVLGSATKVAVAYIQSRRGLPPRSLGQKVGGSLVSLVFCIVAMVALGTFAGRIGVAPDDPGPPTQLIRAGFTALTVIFAYNAASMALSLFIALFLGRAGLTGVALIVLMIAVLAAMNAPPGPGQPVMPRPTPWPPNHAVWRSPTHTLVCSGGAYQLNGVPILLERTFPDRLLFRYPDGTAFEVFRDGRFGYQQFVGGPLLAGFAGGWDAN
jgi:hypothetical protein